MKLYEYIVRRAFFMLFVLLAVSIIVFYLGRGVLPPSSAIAPYITPQMTSNAKLSEVQAAGVATLNCPSWSAFIQKSPGCVVPLWQQYFSWLHNIFRGNWGFSLIPGIAPGTRTWQLFVSRFPYTAELAVFAGTLAVLVALPLGIVSGTHNNRLPDHLSRVLALVGYSLPEFWLGFLFQIVFVLYLKIDGIGILPTNGIIGLNCGLCISNPGNIVRYTGFPLVDSILSLNFLYFWDSFLALVLPAITLAAASLGLLARIVRSSMVEVLRQDYILQARSKGLLERTVVYRHALKNAILPGLTSAGLMFAFLLGGAVVVEYVFSWPGIGQAALQAALYLDINFLELYALVVALIIAISNLVVDILYAIIDPRILRSY
ncbi:MAG: ABC transporter permease [Thaumarchaeota archaeon]|nr:ABC transporter permease [Nitrososphaerota archaeon]